MRPSRTFHLDWGECILFNFLMADLCKINHSAQETEPLVFQMCIECNKTEISRGEEEELTRRKYKHLTWYLKDVPETDAEM